MSQLLPRREPVSEDEHDPDPLFVGLADSDADDVFSVLSTPTARTLLQALYREPRPPSELADVVETSIQNVQYHLDQLQEAGLIEVVSTWYSSRGIEMDVYAPAGDPLVLLAGDGTTDAAVVAACRDGQDRSADVLSADGAADRLGPEPTNT